jgi:hypothetical protein
VATNFRIIASKNGNDLDIELIGDFDGTSAFELINALKECSADNSRIFIHSGGLKNVVPFGRDLFFKMLVPIDGRPSQFVFTENEALALKREYRLSTSSLL